MGEASRSMEFRLSRNHADEPRPSRAQQRKRVNPWVAQLLIDENQTTGANKTPHPELGIC